MVKNIVRDPMFLQQKSKPATEADKQVIHDLLDTLRANRRKEKNYRSSYGTVSFCYGQSGYY